MIKYGEALGWCVRHGAVFRFVHRHARGEFLAANDSIPGEFALELTISLYGKQVAGHYPLDSSKEPSKAVAEALIGCVEWFVKQQQQRLVVGGLN